MAIRFPSPEWTQAFKDAVNANAAYAEHGKGWTHGKVAYVIKADARLGLDHDMAMVLDLHGGKCRGAEYVDGVAAQAPRTQLDPAPQTRPHAPQLLLSVVASTHRAPQSSRPAA